MAVHYIFLILITWGICHSSAQCPALETAAYTQCGYDFPTDNTTVVNSSKACSASCCTALNTYTSTCNDSSVLTAHAAFQVTECSDLVCGDACLDPQTGYMKKSADACGVSNQAKLFSTTTPTLACSASCCSNLTAGRAFCASVTSFTKLEVDVAAFQQYACGNFSCVSGNKCISTGNAVNPDGGYLNRALVGCGTPSLVNFSDYNPDTLSMDNNLTCSNTCCLALDNAAPACSAASDKSIFTMVETDTTMYQFDSCVFQCNTQCFDSVGLFDSRTGAANKALRYCGAAKNFTSILTATSASLNYDANLACSLRCCREVEQAKAACTNNTELDAYLISLYAFQVKTCGTDNFLCQPNDKCFDPLGLVIPGYGALNRAAAKCGAPSVNPSGLISGGISFNASLACTPECCSEVVAAKSYCNNSNDSPLWEAFDAALTGFQLLKCDNGYTCYPNDKCFDVQGLVNSQRGALGRALQSCGIPASVTSFTNGFDNITLEAERACNISCCNAFDNAKTYCNENNATQTELQVYDSFSAALPLYQAAKCANFTCRPKICFDPVGLINSEIGAANKVLKYCGAPADITAIKDLINGSFDRTAACKPRCCQEIEAARPFCTNSSSDSDLFDTMVTAILYYQAGYCKPTFACTDNDLCFDKLGLINPDFGAMNRAMAACGVPASYQSLDQILAGPLSFNESKLCDTQCCTAVAAARPYCNKTDTESRAVQALDISLTASQLYKCANFSCYPNDKCLDPQGFINANFGAINRAMKACGIPAELKNFSLSTDLSQLNISTEAACNFSCCQAIDNAKVYCSANGTVDTEYTAFVTLFRPYQAARCTTDANFSCSPTECFDPVGLINSRLGAANRVMRYCGIVSDVTDLVNVVSAKFNSSIACLPTCCDEIEAAKQYCNTTVGFDALVNAVYAWQAQQCRPTFLCRANDKCIDPLGIYNAELGYANSALAQCGGSAGITNLTSLATAFSGLNGDLACNFNCCVAVRNAQSNCSASGTSISAAVDALYLTQAAICSNFTCKELQCYEPILGVINSQTAPLNKVIVACGGVDFRGLQSGTGNVDTSKLCAASCCDSLYANYVDVCQNSSSFANFQEGLISTQELLCSGGFKCNRIAPVSNAFSLCCGLGFTASIGVIVGIVVGGILLIVAVFVIITCAREEKKFF